MASLAQQIAELQARANAEAQALVDAEKARVAKANISGSKLEESELAKKFDDLQDAINASAPHPVTYIFADLIKHVLSAVHEVNERLANFNADAKAPPAE